MSENYTEDTIKQKLEYLGLDLDNIPKGLKEFNYLDFRPSRFGTKNKYKIYRYLDVKDIEIMLTPANRMDNLADKYR